MSFASQFALGQRIASNLIDTYQDAKKKREITEIADAKPEQINGGFTSEDADQLDAVAKSGMYNIDAATNPDGSFSGYSVSPKSEPGNAGVIATRGVTDFLGKRTTGSMTDDQVSSARDRAMADVITKYDPLQGMQLKRQAKQDARDDVRFGREQKKYDREDGLQAIQDQAGQEFQNSLVGEDGSRRAATPADFVAHQQQLAYRMSNGGFMSEAIQQMQNANAGMVAQLQLETAQRKQAGGVVMQAAQAGDFKPLLEYYNKFVPSGMKATDARLDDSGQIVISGTGMDGKPVQPTTLGNVDKLGYFLKSAEDPAALHQYAVSEFQKNLQLKADKRADRQLALSEASNARAAANDGTMAALRGVELEAKQLALTDLKETAKMPAQVRDQIKGKQELLKNITSTINNAMAKGEFAAGSSQAAALIEQQVKLQTEIEGLYSPYQPEKSKGAGGAARNVGFVDPPTKSDSGSGEAKPETAKPAAVSVAQQRGVGGTSKPPVSREAAVAKAFGATGKGDTLDQLATEKAGQVLQLRQQQGAEQAKLAEIAKSGDPQAIREQAQRVQAIASQVNALIGGYNDAQQTVILNALK